LVTRSSSQTGVPGTVTPWFGLASKHHVYQTFGLRSSVERFFGYLKDRTRVFYNNINPKKTLFMPLVGFLLGGVHCVVHRVEVTRIGLIRTGPVELYYVKRNRAGFRTDIDWNPA
jgi:hypothetical protein